jgi:signal transduction histidine kinase
MVVALALTLGPTVALGYLGYRNLAERERGLRVTYTAAANVVRDRLANEFTTLRATLPAEPPVSIEATRVSAIQTWLRTVAADAPWAADFFVTRSDGAVVTPALWLGWTYGPASAAAQGDDEVAASIRAAETAEFVKHDLAAALAAYRQALTEARSASARALAQSRVARTLVKLRRLDEGVVAYRGLLTSAGDTATVHGLPYAVIAREEIVDGLAALGRAPERDRAAGELLDYVVQRPWDVDAGYGYHLKHAIDTGRTAAAPELQQRAAAGLAEVAAIEHIQQNAAAALVRNRHLPASRIAFGYTVRAHSVRSSAKRAEAGLDLGQDIRIQIEPSANDPAAALASVDVGEPLPGWRLSVVDVTGRTLQQLSLRDRWTYGAVLGLLLAVLVAGVVFTTRAWAREAELSRLRTDFVSNVSHELKTPLALIRMFGETLEAGMVADPAKRHEFYGIIRRESERLTHLINNVLDTAKIDAGTKQFALERGDLVSLVREALDAYSPLFTRLNFDVAASLPDRPLSVRLDRDAVAQALVNLFQNAIRYSDESKHVAVAVEAREKEVVVSVADRGIGIPASELPRIFDKFYRGGAAPGGGSASSTGLGLSIVKHVMTAHGGRVEVRSAVGEGSVFALVFPAEGAAA